MRVSTCLVFSLSSSFVSAQPAGGAGGKSTGGTVSTTCDMYGASATYFETVTNATRSVQSTGCPNYYNQCNKKQCKIPESEATDQAITYDVPTWPVLATTALVDTSCVGGPIGFGLDGVSIYGPGDGTPECNDAVNFEGDTFDVSGGHASAFGEYHYHIPPTALLHDLGNGNMAADGTIQHSPQIGWAMDGFPIYGAFGLWNVTLLPCTHAEANITYCLDDCGGIEGPMPAVDEFLYRYHIAGPVGDLVCSSTVENGDTGICQFGGGGLPDACCVNILPDETYYPYTLACYRGCPISAGDTCIGTPGYTFTTPPVVLSPANQTTTSLTIAGIAPTLLPVGPGP